MTLAEAQLAAQEYRFAIARAELGQQLRSLFAFGIAVRDNLALLRDNEQRARELSRTARELVESGQHAPIRGLLAAAALAPPTPPPRAAHPANPKPRPSTAPLLRA